MMLKLMWSLSLLCAAGCQVSLVARPGQNVSLTCNLTSGLEVLWVRLRSARLLPLLAVQESKLGADTVNVLQGDGGRLGNGGRLAGGGVALHILDVQQEDGGLYCCIGRTGDGWTHRELQLTVNGDDGHAGAVQRPCWTLGVCVLPAAIVFGCLVCVGGVYLCSGKGVCRLSGSVSDLQKLFITPA
ncbi:uncharacterized protein LOC115409200 isoform X2 [Salarias fasciatus]|uniref:uncharacterized protein LOC115409200 isoform X2 n=1 Tax=Salarias fasciatus TaxID=181472 RepID=UPI00117689D0|nr:uncharacterized protein LOC115409200 isoform X2 [Salarias fasciatus]